MEKDENDLPDNFPQPDYKALADQVPGIVYQFRLTPEGGIEIPYINNKVHELTGLRPEEVIADPALMFDQVPAEDRARLEKAIAGSAEQLRDYMVEHRSVATDGRTRWFRVTARPQKDRDGAVLWHGLAIDITESKKSEAALRESEERFRIAGLAAYDLIYEWNVKDDSREWFGDIDGLLGFEKGGIKRDINGWLGLIHPQERPLIKAALERHRTAGDPIGFKYRIRHQNGDYRYWKDHALPLLDEEGLPRKWIGACLDITRRKNIESSLLSSEELLKSFMNNTPVGLGIFDSEFRYVFINDTLQKINGASREEHIGKSIEEILPEGAELIRPLFEKIMSDGRPILNMELSGEVPSRPGEASHFLTSYFPIFDKDGKPIRIGAAVVDITEQERAREALKLNEEKYRELVENANSLIFKLDNRGRITFFNEFAQDYFGYSERELLHKSPLGTIIPPYESSGRNLAELFNKLMESPERYESNENENIRKNGGRCWVAWRNKPIYDDKGRKTGLLCVGNDITDRKHMEARLRHAHKLEALGTLAGGIAHDFNNILMAITGYSELAMLDIEKGVSNGNRLREILKAGARAKKLVDQILSFSRKVEPELRPVDLNILLAQTAMILERAIPKMIRLENRFAKNLWPINADPAQMAQVLMNLGTNARDSMPEGGVIRIRTENVVIDAERNGETGDEEEAVSGKYVLLDVSDTGHGMDRETLEHIFDPFYTRKEVGKGTGLGLASVYGIVKSHGGHLECRSRVGQGTVFKIYLPAIEPRDRSEKREPEPAIPPGGKETVLLVDDEEPLRELGKEILQVHGYQVKLARTGEEALEIYKKDRDDIDLVLLDLSMPGMGGQKCLEKLTRFDPGVKVIITSGYSLHGRTKDISSAGASEFVAKPFRSRDMLKAIRNVLDR